MIKLKTKSGNVFLNVLNIVSGEQNEREAVKIWSTRGTPTETTEEFDVVVKKIEKMLIRIAGGVHV